MLKIITLLFFCLFLNHCIFFLERLSKLPIEPVNSSHRQMMDEEAKHIAAVDAFKVVDQKIQDLNT